MASYSAHTYPLTGDKHLSCVVYLLLLQTLEQGVKNENNRKRKINIEVDDRKPMKE